MTQVAVATEAVATSTPIPVAKALPWALLVGLIAAFAYYFVGMEQGATSLVQGMGIHEWFHDVRHLLGFPCH